VRKLAEKLGDGRDLRYALLQLWYAAGRGKLQGTNDRLTGIRVGIGFAIGAVAVFVFVSGAINRLLTVFLAVVVFTLVQVVLGAARPWFARTERRRIPSTYQEFQREMTKRWPEVYGGQLPPGAVDERVPRPIRVPQFRYAVLCPDHAVLACLAANNISHSTALAFAGRIEDLPLGVPVIVLHDASVPGVIFASRARAELGPRVVVVAGLVPRVALANASSLRLRDNSPDAEALAQLPRESLSQAEIDWLATGWWSPIAALPPAKLLAMVERSVERIENAADPDRRHARAIGFLTWPTR
jgi:hypothetical protein